jgi:transcription elongation factor Elf1
LKDKITDKIITVVKSKIRIFKGGITIMTLRACPKCQHRFYQIMEHASMDAQQQEHYVMCSSCGTLLGKFREYQGDK